MKKIKIILFVFFSVGLLQSQNKLLTIQDAVLKGRTSLAPERLQYLQFTSDSKYFFYKKNNAILFFNCSDLKPFKTISLTNLNQELKKQNSDTLSNFPLIENVNNCFEFATSEGKFAYNYLTNVLSSTKANSFLEKENADKSPVNDDVAYTIDNNLYASINGIETQITKDGNYNLVYGKTVHRDEFGIHKGTYWSPKGNFLGFYRMDQSDVTDYPIIDWSTNPATNKNIKYPMAGGKSHYVTVGIYNVNTKTTTYVKTEGPKDQYLTNISYSPDEKYIYIVVLNREQNHFKVNEYEVATGNFVRTLFEEKDEKYVEPLHAMEFLGTNPNQFIWQSNRDGFNHVYLYDIKGTVIKQLTKGNFEVKEFVGFDAKCENGFYYANAESPTNQDMYVVNLKTGVNKRITQGNGYHACVISKDFKHVIDIFTSCYVPRDYSLINIASNKTSNFYKAPNPIEAYALGKWNMFTLKNDEGTTLHARMFKPINFDSTKKYPVLVYLYNGPHVQLVTNTWMAGGELWYQYMAQKGFIVFTLDGRGSDFRGKTFEQAIHRKLGTCEMEDHLIGVNYLKSLPYVDGSRIGVHGWSYGGFMTTSLMTLNPGVFKVGCAGGPVIDWNYYEIMYGERYMDTPQENPDGYKANNLLNHVDKLKGKLLMIHGAQDDVVVLQHNLLYQKKAVDKGVQLDFYLYPGHAHNVLGKDRAHLMEKICNYFIDNL